jgi:hypothetical protein
MRKAIGKSASAILGTGRRAARCSHHWIIEVAIGPLSKGVCKVCGAEKEFRNQLRWDEVSPSREPAFGHRHGKGDGGAPREGGNQSPRGAKGIQQWPEAPAAI